MKLILWILPEREIRFNVTWIEYLILRNIFKKKKYEIIKKELRGERADVVIYEEFVNL